MSNLVKTLPKAEYTLPNGCRVTVSAHVIRDVTKAAAGAFKDSLPQPPAEVMDRLAYNEALVGTCKALVEQGQEHAAALSYVIDVMEGRPVRATANFGAVHRCAEEAVVHQKRLLALDADLSPTLWGEALEQLKAARTMLVADCDVGEQRLASMESKMAVLATKALAKADDVDPFSRQSMVQLALHRAEANGTLFKDELAAMHKNAPVTLPAAEVVAKYAFPPELEASLAQVTDSYDMAELARTWVAERRQAENTRKRVRKACTKRDIADDIAQLWASKKGALA